MRYKTQAKRALRAAGLRKHHARWVVTGDMPGPGEARLLDETLKRMGVQPEPWDAVVDPADAASARWYDPAARDAAIESWRARPQ
jgi:hypothetical protein